MDRAQNPRALGGLAMLLGLTGFAFVQPVLSVLGENPSVFAQAGVDEWRLVAFAAFFVLMPAVVLWSLWRVAARISEPVGAMVFWVAAGALVAIAVVQWMRSAGIELAWLQVIVALIGAATFVAAATRFAGFQQWLTMTAVLPAIAFAAFVFASPAADLIGQPNPDIGVAREVAGGPNVVMVVLDEFPTLSLLDDEGSIDQRRFPNLDRLAQQATWYPNFTATAPHTANAIPALMTGRWPTADDPLFAKHPDNLFRAFAPTHHLTAFEAVSSLCGLSACVETGPTQEANAEDAKYDEVLSLARDVWLDRWVPGRSATSDFGEFAETVVVSSPQKTPDGGGNDFADLFGQDAQLAKPERFNDFVATLAPDGRSTFYYLHLVLPHSPFRFHPSGASYSTEWATAGAYAFSANNDAGPWIAALTEQRHLLQAQFADRLVGELLDELEALDMFDDSLIVVVADHGASFRPGTPFREVTADNIAEIAYVPLFVKAPGQSVGAVDPANVMTHDVAPTVAALAGVTLGDDVDGFAAGSPQIDDRGDAKTIFDFGPPLVAAPSEPQALQFTGAEVAPNISMRAIGPLADAADPLAGLHRAAGVGDLIGQPFDDVVTTTEGHATIPRLGAFVGGADDRPGIVGGVVGGTAARGPVVLAVDGIIVAGSQVTPFGEAERYFAMVYPERFLGTPVTIEVGIVTDGGVVMLESREG